MKKDLSKNNFEYTHIPWHLVAQDIDEYIIPECQEACKYLWAKNIGTFMCSNRSESDDTKYILLNNMSTKVI